MIWDNNKLSDQKFDLKKFKALASNLIVCNVYHGEQRLKRIYF